MANGTIAFDTLQTSGQITGTAKSVDTDYVVTGSPKHWVNYDAVSQVTHGSLNQASLTDNGTGDFTTTYSNNLSGAENKCIVFGAWNTADNGSNLGAGNTRGGTTCGQYGAEASATSKVRYATHYGSTAASDGGVFDYEGNYCSTLGDLA